MDRHEIIKSEMPHRRKKEPKPTPTGESQKDLDREISEFLAKKGKKIKKIAFGISGIREYVKPKKMVIGKNKLK